MHTSELPPFDPKAACIKCGWSIPDPVAPAPKFISTGSPAAPAAKKPAEKAAIGDPAAGKQGILHQDPAPPPSPPTVSYCNGSDCPWDDEGNGTDEHMHQFCDTCGFEWLSKPLG